MEVKDTVVIVTGGVNGMGYEATRHLLENGAKFVAIFDLVSSDGVGAVNNLEKEYGKGRAGFYPGDITNDDKLEENFKKVIQEHGTIDILINNAGIANEKNIQRLVDVNVKAAFSSSYMAINHMGKHKGGKGGLIINISAILGLSDCPILPFYSATKHAIIGFTRCMKDNYPTTGVRVVSICPGVTRANSIKEIPFNFLDFISDKIIDKVLTEIPVQSPKSVALAIIEIIKKGECGAVWVVENDKKPFAIKPSDHYIRLGVPIEK